MRTAAIQATYRRLLVCALLASAVASCKKADDLSTCVGEGTINVALGIGELSCDGFCDPDTTFCTIQGSTNEHGGTREWCGCPGMPEPSKCHTVKIKPGPGEGGGPAYFACAGSCADPKEVCTMDTTVIERQPDGSPRTLKVKCQCE